jgi:hypothetical protein
VGLDGCEVRLCGPCAFVRPRVPCVNVNTTDATAGATRYGTVTALSVLEVTQTHIHIHTRCPGSPGVFLPVTKQLPYCTGKLFPPIHTLVRTEWGWKQS